MHARRREASRPRDLAHAASLGVRLSDRFVQLAAATVQVARSPLEGDGRNSDTFQAGGHGENIRGRRPSTLLDEGSTMTIAVDNPTKNPEARKSALAQAVSNAVRHGWRVESQTDYQAVLVKGNRTNHVLHLILTIVTLGLWAIVWILVAVLGGEKRRIIAVDEFGGTRVQG